ncbi:MAG: UPF0182 family protein, partial [Mogibacterium diversum]|nr:UPF0182 family protein [Mogibacterium diversum]
MAKDKKKGKVTYTFNGEGKRRNVFGKLLVIAIFVIVIVGRSVGFLTDWMWFRELGFTRVFWTQLATELKLGIVIFLISGLLVRVYLNSLRKGYFSKIESHEIPDMHKLNVLSWVISVIFGVVAAFVSATSTWQSFLMFANSSKFGLKDPIFGLDISFYVFKLDFLSKLNSIAIFVIIGVVIVTLIYYAVLLSVRKPDIFDKKDVFENLEADDAAKEAQAGDETSADDEVRKGRPDNSIPFGKKDPVDDVTRIIKGFSDKAKEQAKKRRENKREINRSNVDHLFSLASGKAMILGVVFYVMLGIHFVLKQFTLLHAHTGTVYGAGFTDIAITQKVYLLVMILAVVGAITLVRHVHKKEYLKLARVPMLIIGVLFLGTILKVGVQSLIVAPDEINKESKYIKNNIQYTNHAYGLD